MKQHRSGQGRETVLQWARPAAVCSQKSPPACLPACPCPSAAGGGGGVQAAEHSPQLLVEKVWGVERGSGFVLHLRVLFPRPGTHLLRDLLGGDILSRHLNNHH